MRNLVRLALTLVTLVGVCFLSTCGDGGGGTEPDQVPAETLVSFSLTVPDSITEVEPFSLTVTAVGNRGSNPLTSYSGSVTLSTTVGTVVPANLAVSNGTGSVQVTLSTPGQQTLTASGSGRTGSASVDVTDLPDPPIDGDPQATLEQAAPDSMYLPDPDDYSNGHPDLTGMYLSHNVVLMAFALGTTVQQANDLLTPLGGAVVGGIQGMPGQVPSVLIVKLATATHAEIETALVTLRASPIVLHAVQDALLSTDALPEYTWWTPDTWIWDGVQPAGGNWGMELIRVPLMWNLNRAIQKVDPTVWTGVLDTGLGSHVDFFDRPKINLSLGVESDHGTHVAGIIGADFWNGLGVEGVNPFSGIVFLSAASVGVGTGMVWYASAGAAITALVLQMAAHSSQPVVINTSLGYNWAAGGIDTNTSAAAQTIAETHGALLKAALNGLSLARSLPIITASSGNDSNDGFGLQLARYSSPMCNAAVAHGAANIFVVESVRYDAGSRGESTRSDFSNIGGHISAPGSEILSTTPGNGMKVFSGTSMAAPHVAGLVGYMLAVDPTLTIPQVYSALLGASVPVAGLASNRIDAWAAVMQIDQVQGDERVLKMMLDIDDGTVDGNQRVDYDDGPLFLDYDEDDADEDGGLGDGEIDMSDFRVWRDWYLKTSGVEADHFDGREDHPKMDVNDNGVIEDDAGESIYPRGDFNGDGKLSIEEEDVAFVPGAIQEEVSDLDVLKSVFDDPDYDKDNLDTLVLSSDVTVDASIAFELYTNSPIKAEMWQAGLNTLSKDFMLTAEEPRKTFTVRSLPIGYWLEVRIGTESRFADNGWRVLATHPGTDLVMWPIKPIPVDEKSTFLNSCDDPGATTAQGIPLASLRVGPGDFVYLEAAYDTPRAYESVAVFSASGQIKVETEEIPVGEGEDPLILTKRTVTDAITMGADLLWGRPFASPPTQKCDGILTDIPQDIHMLEGAFLKIPDGATHLFLGMASDYYDDNGTGSNRVRTSKWYAPEWFDMHAPVSPVRKER